MSSLAVVAAGAIPAAVVLVAPASVVAQDFSTGSLTGTVRDDAGTPIPGARVEVQSDSQGFTRQLTTDSGGVFRAALIPVGSYTVTISADGYGSISQSANVRLGGESAFGFTLPRGGVSSVEELVITAPRPDLAFTQTTTGLTVDLHELVERVPGGRDLTSVILLAPTAVQGDSAFGNQPSLGGSSVAENAFYVNGLNITNFNNYIGGSAVPFDFYRSVEVKVGGYPAEFGRATGGVVNAVTKSGSNDFEFALRGNFAPDLFRSQAYDTYSARNLLDERDSSSLTVEAGGPIIRDRLFFYGLAQFNDT